MAEPPIHPIQVVGFHGGRCFGAEAEAALRAATVVIGAARHLAALPAEVAATRVELDGPVADALAQAAELRAAGQRVCLAVSGDPGFFGLARLAAARLEPSAFEVHPAPAAVALAFARLHLSWDDAVVVSAHGRSLEAAAEAVIRHPKVAVLTSPDNRPETLGRKLEELGCPPRSITVASHLGESDEALWNGTIDELARGGFDPVSIVVCLAPAGPDDTGPGWAWGMPDSTFDHRGGMITKAEVRAVALGKLRLPRAGVLWDIGAGSGSVAAECARLAPGLQVFAVERSTDDVDRVRRNLAGTTATVIAGEAPAALADLPDPDRAFIGGGGIEVLDHVLTRLRPGGTVVATYAALDRAVAAAGRLGEMVQIAVSRAAPLGPDRAIRLAAENPVFVCWGPANAQTDK